MEMSALEPILPVHKRPLWRRIKGRDEMACHRDLELDAIQAIAFAEKRAVHAARVEIDIGRNAPRRFREPVGDAFADGGGRADDNRAAGLNAQRLTERGAVTGDALDVG